MSKKPLYDALGTVILVMCALLMTGNSRLGWRSNLVRHKGDEALRDFRSLPDSLVRNLNEFAMTDSNTSTGVSVTEFIDVECPYCATFMLRVDSAEAILGDSMHLRYVNFPLDGHRFAVSGAIAITCAFRDGYGESFVRSVYADRDSIGFWSWGKFAEQAGAPDSGSFERCRSDRGVASHVERSKLFGKKARVKATPTVILGDSIYAIPPTLDELLRDIRQHISKGR